MQTPYIIRLDGMFEGDFEAAQQKAQDLYNWCEQNGVPIQNIDIARMREDNPIEVFTLGSSSVLRNNKAKESLGATA